MEREGTDDTEILFVGVREGEYEVIEAHHVPNCYIPVVLLVDTRR